jgi:hypothetical protein
MLSSQSAPAASTPYSKTFIEGKKDLAIDDGKLKCHCQLLFLANSQQVLTEICQGMTTNLFLCKPDKLYSFS